MRQIPETGRIGGIKVDISLQPIRLSPFKKLDAIGFYA